MSQAMAAVQKPALAATNLSTAAFDETGEYHKIVHFRDAVLSGKHAHIKVPASTVAKHAAASASASAHPPAPTSTTLASQSSPSSAPQLVAKTASQAHDSKAVNGHALGNAQSFKTNAQQPYVTLPPATISSVIPGFASSFSGLKPAINPVLLQKSDDLVKAELQIQRQRIEKALGDQIEQRKLAAKNIQFLAEQSSDLDLPDILAKALTLVQATTPQPISTINSSAANASDATDSFDDSTFYSSPVVTPASHPSVPQVRSGSEDMRMQYAQKVTRPIEKHSPLQRHPTSQPAAVFNEPVAHPVAPQMSSQRRIIDDRDPYSPSGLNVLAQCSDPAGTAHTRVQTPSRIDLTRQREHLEALVISSASRGASRSDNSGNTDSDMSADQQRSQNQQHPGLIPGLKPPREPVVRVHNLSPLAPQPAHVSPLATARQPPMRDLAAGTQQRVPSQLTAVRQEQALVISPESSSQGDKGSKKKSKKKPQRKSDVRARELQGSPEIKPEPKSPSPLTAPPFMPPNKRPRRSGRQDAQVIYDEPALGRPISLLEQERFVRTNDPPGTMQIDTVDQGFERVSDAYPRQVRRSVAPRAQEPEETLYEERRADGTIVRYVRRAQSPTSYADPYGPIERRPVRTASYSVVNPTPDVRESSVYGPLHREGRMSVRPHVERGRSRSPIVIERRSSAMPPPTQRRIVLDEYGREYYEPLQPVAGHRQSMMPPSRPGEYEVIYERAPTRAISRMPAPEIIGEDGTIYRRASPGYAPRRVVTQPDYHTDLRSYRERDYMGPPNQDYLPAAAPEHVPREYLPRAASVRPTEPMSYSRLASTHPELPPRQYAASVHPEARRDNASHVVREYSVRPAEVDLAQRAYSTRPVERYYEHVPQREVTYTGDGTRHEIIRYSDDAAPRRQVYQ
ncbi:hypothetical protein GGR57DRAFT_197431 [Xylariaceae sp. FL1272]|nr:hypothetical protein GGR57DRAFT_197431 [Xylariaceae sp. FL1272]